MKEWKNRYTVGVFVYRDADQIGVVAPYINWIGFYMGYSKTAANAATFKACEYAYKDPLAKEVVALRDDVVIFTLELAH